MQNSLSGNSWNTYPEKVVWHAWLERLMAMTKCSDCCLCLHYALGYSAPPVHTWQEFLHLKCTSFISVQFMRVVSLEMWENQKEKVPSLSRYQEVIFSPNFWKLESLAAFIICPMVLAMTVRRTALRSCRLLTNAARIFPVYGSTVCYIIPSLNSSMSVRHQFSHQMRKLWVN